MAIRMSSSWYTVNLVYSIKHDERKRLRELMDHVEPGLYKRTQSHMTRPQAETLAELMRSWDFPVEVNETSALSF